MSVPHANNRPSAAMRCQRCEKPATFHITELTGGKPQELHLCEECARGYLTQGEPQPAAAPSLKGVLANQLKVGQTAEELAGLDQRTCPVCGISFFEFRNQGRFGCPHDYVCFGEELEPLLINIHGETGHRGKVPRQHPEDTDTKTEVIRLRREIKAAVAEEDYERASSLRDKIRQIENQKEQADS